MKHFKLAFLFFLSQTNLLGQGAREILSVANSANITKNDFFEEVKFQDRFGYFIIPVTIGNDTYDYIFDTGGYNTITSSIKEKNNLTDTLKVEVGSANQIKKKVILGRLPNLAIKGISFNNVGVFNFDFDESPLIKCYTNGGLIGKGIIKGAIWQIDYQNKAIRITDDLSRLEGLDNAIKLKVRLDKTYNPFIKARINGKMREFMLDFGFGGFISLTNKTAQSILKAQSVEVTGEGTIGANGVAEDNIFYSHIDEFKIGNRSFTRQIAYHSKPNNYDLIGSEISKYFMVTLNLAKKELYLTPYPDDKPEKDFSTFGIDLNIDDQGAYINRLHMGTSIQKQGLKLHDRVISINGADPLSFKYCDFYFHTRRLLKSDDPLQLIVERQGKKHVFEVKKEHILAR